MADNPAENVTVGVRGRVVDKAIENLKAKKPDLPEEFLGELRVLFAAEKVPKADAYLQLFDKQIGGSA